ncbi:transcriptional regulator BetI [Marinomonas sp. 15G1-11]|uniref:HTH-type transcriptional regulator BetI n=1 Tax=Marinomonas phaeophyticola TaxID=3004091 RepID=A0ABT4JPK2_9GAMM|nr:transcriptional regulator BetI [Marinomonas sp. 15G1-11]MCZ2720071.1 transcriptional regulator BetI [Marinomonas sp. 15G1-11]
MPKVGMPAIRKPQLIQAAIEAIDERGFSGATVSVIGKKAGVSPAIINHYFGGKNGLLEETMKSLIREFFLLLKQELVRGKKASGIDKVMIIVKTSFSHSQTQPEVVKVWMGFWALAMHSHVFLRLQRVYSKRLKTALVMELKAILDIQKAREVAHIVASLIDGMWLRGSLDGGINKSYSTKLIRSYLELEIS